MKGQKLHLLTIMEYVRKQDSFKKEIGGFSYELRVHSLFREQLWRSQAGTKRLWQIRLEACQCRLGQLQRLLGCRDDERKIIDYFCSDHSFKSLNLAVRTLKSVFPSSNFKERITLFSVSGVQ